jgi:hypothetical protein
VLPEVVVPEAPRMPTACASQDTTRIRYTITKAGGVDYSKFGQELIASIKSLM